MSIRQYTAHKESILFLVIDTVGYISTYVLIQHLDDELL